MGTLGRKAVWGAALALWVMIPAASASASGGSGKLDNLLKQGSESAQTVIIRYRSDAKHDDVKHEIERHKGRVVAEHRLIRAMTAVLSAAEIAELASNSDVLSVSADADVAASATTTTSSDGTASVLKRAIGLQDWFTGSSMTIAVIDSGVQNLTDFNGRLVGTYDFTNGRDGVAISPLDEYGHGTHVAGLLGSSGASSNGKYAGVAPGVKILALKVLDKKGSGKTSSVINALQFAVANKDRFGIRVVNLSLGHPIYESAATDPLVQAVEAAVRSGLIVVAAAGNYGTNPTTGLQGYAGIASPGNAPSAITVGATNTFGTDRRADDRVASYSSRGPSWYDGIAKPDFVAPGSNLISSEVDGSTLAVDYPTLVVREGASKYLKLNGSSMSSAVVSGLIAVMIEANDYGNYQRWQDAQTLLKRSQRSAYPGAPVLTANAIKAMLQYSATPLRDANGVTYDGLVQGAGEVNGLGAITLAYFTDTTKTAGSFWLATAFPAVSPYGGVDEPWSQSVIWGTRLVTGSSIIEVNETAWASNIVWGTGELDNIVWGTVNSDDNIVWGTMFGTDNIVWGASLFLGNAAFGDNIVWGTAMTWDDNIVWGTNLLGMFDGDNIVWGTMFFGADNIVWGTLNDDNIVWGTSANKVTVLGTTVTGGGL
jgi:serine protease AprX